MSEISSLGIGAVAIAISVYSLWRTYWRRGRLRVVDPRSFVVSYNNGRPMIILPLLFYNFGARPALIFSLRLLLKSEQATTTLYLTAIKQGLVGDGGENPPVDYRTYAASFPVLSGHRAQTVYCEFQGSISEQLKTGVLRAVLESRSGLGAKWTHVTTFNLYYPAQGGFIYDNDPESAIVWTGRCILDATLPDGTASKSFTKV
jgi:hypothetical protein